MNRFDLLRCSTLRSSVSEDLEAFFMNAPDINESPFENSKDDISLLGEHFEVKKKVEDLQNLLINKNQNVSVVMNNNTALSVTLMYEASKNEELSTEGDNEDDATLPYEKNSEDFIDQGDESTLPYIQNEKDSTDDNENNKDETTVMFKENEIENLKGNFIRR